MKFWVTGISNQNQCFILYCIINTSYCIGSSLHVHVKTEIWFVGRRTIRQIIISEGWIIFCGILHEYHADNGWIFEFLCNVDSLYGYITRYGSAVITLA
jgi:hypothetical protein